MDTTFVVSFSNPAIHHKALISAGHRATDQAEVRVGERGPSYETSHSQEALVTFWKKSTPLHPSIPPPLPQTPTPPHGPSHFLKWKESISHVSLQQGGWDQPSVQLRPKEPADSATDSLPGGRGQTETGLQCRLGVRRLVLPFKGRQRCLVLTLGVSLECHELTASLLSMRLSPLSGQVENGKWKMNLIRLS